MTTVSDNSSNFKPAPQGLHSAVCADEVDLGMVQTSYAGKPKTTHKVRLVWQIEECDPETGKRYIVSERYTASLHEKAALRKALESWRGRPFTAEECKGFDLERLVGINCQLQVIHNTKNGKTYANVAAVVPAAKGQPRLDVKDYVRVKDRQTNAPEEPGTDADDDTPF